MIPFNLLPKQPLEYGEIDKIRLDEGLTTPNPFGDSYCLICDAVSGMWRLVKKDTAPASPGYGWDIGGHNISVAEDPNPDPNYPDIVLQDGSGSFDRWKDNQDGTYSPRYTNNFAALTKDSLTGLITITQKDQTVMNFRIDGKIETIVDRNGNTLTYNYDDQNNPGRLTSIDDGEGRSQTYVYSGQSTDGRIDDGQPYQIISQDPNRLVTFGYDVNNRLSTVTDAMGDTITMEYYSDGSLKKKIDARGQTEVEYTYHMDGRVETETRYGEQRFTYSYAGDAVTGYVMTVVEEDLTLADPSSDLRTTVYTHNDRYRLVKVVDPLGNVHRWEYNDANNPYLMTAEIDPNGVPTRYIYDSLGNVIKVTDAQGNVTELTYKEGYLVETIQRPAVTVGQNLVQYEPTTLGYDLAGNLTSVTDILDGNPVTTTFGVRSSDGRVISVTNRMGETTSFEYTTESSTENAGNISKVIFPGGPNSAPDREIVFVYDKSDNRRQVKDAAENTVEYDFDFKNRPTKITDALGKYVEYGYLEGLLNFVDMPSLRDATSESGLRRRTRYTRDDPGRVLQVLSKINGANEEMRVRHEYDGRSNLKKLARLTRDLSKNIVEKDFQFGYDVLNRPIEQLNPLGNISTIEHDPYCNSFTTKSARGIETLVRRDSLCRVTEISNSDEVRELEYDELSRLVKSTQTRYPGGRYVDPQNLPTESPPSRFGQARYGGASISETTTYLYDELDRLVQVTYPGEKVVFYEYDLEDRLTQLTDMLGNVTQYSYYNDGLLYQVVTCRAF